MEAYQRVAVVAVLLVAIASNGVILELCNAQSICNMSSEGLMACKPSVTPPKPTKPTAACCTALSHADIPCLCSYKKSNMLPALGIDPNLAMQLPDKCKLPHPAKC